ncbi:hypothetical protein HDU96_011132 [Phlyctochytrium bullatum]|nr:hypothetical protein HDU96_011132 [Phlyctochytrium bullatum]
MIEQYLFVQLRHDSEMLQCERLSSRPLNVAQAALQLICLGVAVSLIIPGPQTVGCSACDDFFDLLWRRVSRADSE